jgi:CCR4-NOT transcription complex subunit 3
LEDSITRHKLHLIKLELILRLLDNGGLSPDQVNEVKDFVEDYIERNQVLTFVFLFDHLEELF